MCNLGMLLLILSISVSVSAQQKFAFDSVSRSVTYKQSFKLNPKVKEEDVFAVAEKWFTENPGKFVQKNADLQIDTVKAKRNKNQVELDKEFGNIRPLQSLEPTGGKIVGMGLLKYYGGSTSSIRLLYIKYDLYLKIEQDVLSLSIANVRYFHFNPSTYAKMGIYGFNGGQPCEPMSNLEYLIDCETAHNEFGALASCFNKETSKLFADLKGSLKTNKVLYEPKTVSSVPDPKPKTKANPKKT